MIRCNPPTIQVAGVVSLHGVADALNARGIHTARGGKWYASTVRNMLLRQERA
jgi:Recombinase